MALPALAHKHRAGNCDRFDTGSLVGIFTVVIARNDRRGDVCRLEHRQEPGRPPRGAATSR